MSFMTSDEILDAIKNDEIRIAYYSLPASKGKYKTIPEKKLFVSPDAQSDESEYATASRAFLLDSLKGDSLYLHIGSYARVENPYRGRDSNRVSGKHPAYNFKVKGDDKGTITEIEPFIVYPQESILIGTNEYIELSGNIGASIYATVSKTDVGFAHISTIIDPWWEGVLQIGLYNGSKYSQCLNFLDKICTVRFHRLEKPVDEKYKKREDWSHFSNNYWFEEEEERELFPLNKSVSYTTSISLQDDVKNQLSNLLVRNGNRLREIRKILLDLLKLAGILGILTAIFFVVKFIVYLGELEGLSEKVTNNTISITALNKDLSNLNKQRLQTGFSEVVFQKSDLFKAKTLSIYLGDSLSEPPTLFVTFEDLPTDQVVYRIDYPSERLNDKTLRYKQAILTLNYIGNSQISKDIKGKVKWLIIDPLKP